MSFVEFHRSSLNFIEWNSTRGRNQETTATASQSAFSISSCIRLGRTESQVGRSFKASQHESIIPISANGFGQERNIQFDYIPAGCRRWTGTSEWISRCTGGTRWNRPIAVQARISAASKRKIIFWNFKDIRCEIPGNLRIYRSTVCPNHSIISRSIYLNQK